jgi:hypothetical protein
MPWSLADHNRHRARWAHAGFGWSGRAAGHRRGPAGRLGTGGGAGGWAGQIQTACRERGFFYVTGHGVPAGLLGRRAEASAEFFALPLADKHAGGYLDHEHRDSDDEPGQSRHRAYDRGQHRTGRGRGQVQ